MTSMSDIRTVGCMKFHADIAKQIVEENREKLANFFNNPTIIYKVNAGEWGKLYYEHAIFGAVTCALLLAGIDFMSGPEGKGLYSIPSDFAGLEGTGVLASIDIPEGVQYIGWDAFNSQTNLEYITLPSTLEKIGEGAFCYTGLSMHDNVQRVKYNGTKQEFIDKVNITDHTGKITPIFDLRGGTGKIYCTDGVVEHS